MSSRLPDRIGVRAVLYTEDFEPITVLELPPAARALLEKLGHVQLQVLEVVTPWLEPRLGKAFYDGPKTVRIYAELADRGKCRHLMLFTPDDENALLLKSAFLPGQRKEVMNERADAFARGFLEAIRSIC